MKHLFFKLLMLSTFLILSIGGQRAIGKALHRKPAMPFARSTTRELLVEPYPGLSFTELSFYVVAHQDDWQLFIGHLAQNDISNFHFQGETIGYIHNPNGSTTSIPNPNPTGGAKAVFIYLTGGTNKSDTTYGLGPYDPNQPQNPNPPHVPYYLVREAGAINSIQLAVNRSGAPNALTPYPEDNQHYGITPSGLTTKYVRKYEYRNTVSYFLRIDGDSFEGGTYANGTLATVDNSGTIYNNWCEVISTVAKIYQLEMSTTATNVVPWLNIPDTSNPNYGGINHAIAGKTTKDHDSHISAGKVGVMAAKAIHSNMNTVLYAGYPIGDMVNTLSGLGIEYKAGLAAVYNMALTSHGLWSEWHSTVPNEHLFQDWCANSAYQISTINQIGVFRNCSLQTNRDEWGVGMVGGEWSRAATLGTAASTDPTLPSLELFPNPTSHSFIVKASPNSTLLEIRLRDMRGQEIKYLDAKNKLEQQFDVSDIATGMYNAWIVQVSASGIKMTTPRKVMVKN